LIETIFLLVAFLLAVLLIVAIVIVTGVTSHQPGRMFSYLMLLITCVSVGQTLLSERVLKIEEYGLSISSESDIGGTILAKLLLLVVVGCSVALCVSWPFVAQKNRQVLSRFGMRGLVEPNEIVISFMIFFVAFSIVPILFGAKYYFHVSLVYPFFVFLALFLWVRLSSIDPVIVAKHCLGLLVVVSLGSAAFLPELAIQPGYQSFIPGFDIRLWGVTSHANSLGAIAATFLLFEVAEPSERKWLRNCILVAATIALIMTQSKTSIMATFFGLIVLAWWRLQIDSKKKDGSNVQNKSLVAIVLIAVSIVLIVVSSFWIVFSEDLSLIQVLEGGLTSSEAASVMSASGRTTIWDIAIQGGLENPLFGQGGSFWTETRLMRDLSAASSAHNLFLQVFSRSGFFGLFALLLFFYFLLQYSIRASSFTRGGSVAFMVLFLTRGIFEAAIQPNSILAGEFFAMMFFFLYVIDRGAKPIKEVQGLA
jgi:exopolysaccharide production protein ExoQ